MTREQLKAMEETVGTANKVCKKIADSKRIIEELEKTQYMKISTNRIEIACKKIDKEDADLITLIIKFHKRNIKRLEKELADL